jgi:hypothetical protein
LVPHLMRPVAVVVPRVLGQDLLEVLVTVDQQVVQAFAAQRCGEPFGEGVRRGEWIGVLLTRVPFPVNT